MNVCLDECLPRWRSASMKVHLNEGLPQWRSASMKVHLNEGLPWQRSASTKVCLDEGLPWWRSALMNVCLDVGLPWWRSALMKVCLDEGPPHQGLWVISSEWRGRKKVFWRLPQFSGVDVWQPRPGRRLGGVRRLHLGQVAPRPRLLLQRLRLGPHLPPNRRRRES